MNSKNNKFLILIIAGTCTVSACNSSGTVNTGLGSITAEGSIKILKFKGDFTPIVEPTPTPAPTTSPPPGPTPMPTATPTPVPPSNATGNVNVEIKENITNINNNTTIFNINVQNISSEITQTTVEAEDGSSPTVIVLPNGTINNHTVNLNKEQVNLIKSEKAIIKVKTKNHPNGEIKCKLNKQ